MHIVAYLFIIVANAIQITLFVGSFIAVEISTIFLLVVYAICTFIFGFIINTIVTKIENATNFAKSISSSLINLETGSVVE
jgi:hypothetical protein